MIFTQKNKSAIKKLITTAYKEDIPTIDITTKNFVSKEATAKAEIIAKQNGTLSGIEIAKECFNHIDKKIVFTIKKKDKSYVRKGNVIAIISGKKTSILTAERVALNFLQHLSGIATTTNNYTKKVRDKKTKILDTRKTIPGLRLLEKYAVSCGGGQNHRLLFQL